MSQFHAAFCAHHSAAFNLQTPPEGAIVSLHYVGKFADTGKEFESSYTRGQPFSFTIGEGRVIKGWDVAVRTMKKGEQCIIILSSDYGYGNLVRPTISILIYELTPLPSMGLRMILEYVYRESVTA